MDFIMIDHMVTVIIPVYNAEKYLERTIQSILGQTYSEWELLLIDDCSTDQSRLLMRKYEKQYDNIHCYYCEENKGPSQARNLGIEKAQGRYISFVDSDDLWVPEKLEKQMRFMAENQYAFTFTSYEFADETAARTGIISHAPQCVGYKDLLKSSTIAPSTTMFDRKKIPDELIKMPIGVAREDAATWMKITKNGYYAYGLDEVLTIYCRHKGAYSGNKFKAIIGKWELYHDIEHMPFWKSAYYVVVNTWAAVMRRI